MAARIVNPLYFEVDQPDEETWHQIDRWAVSGNSDEIPEAAWYLVLVNIY
jgi:hypothetical protein